MTDRRHHRLNLVWVALAAVAGLLSAGDVAKACAEVKAVPKACCTASPSAACGCCGSTAPIPEATRSRAAEWLPISAQAGVSVARPGSSCECRSNEPAAPAPKPDSRPSDESRNDQGHEQVIAYLAYAPRPFVPAIRLVSPNDSPPKSPLYLRTLHLLV